MFNNASYLFEEYRGCLVKDDRIIGLCFTKFHSATLRERLKDPEPFDRINFWHMLSEAIERLHRYYFTHNGLRDDFLDDNLLVDETDEPIIMNMGLCQWEGERLGERIRLGGTGRDQATATRENDYYALSKIGEELFR